MPATPNSRNACFQEMCSLALKSNANTIERNLQQKISLWKMQQLAMQPIAHRKQKSGQRCSQLLVKLCKWRSQRCSRPRTNATQGRQLCSQLLAKQKLSLWKMQQLAVQPAAHQKSQSCQRRSQLLVKFCKWRSRQCGRLHTHTRCQRRVPKASYASYAWQLQNASEEYKMFPGSLYPASC